MNAYRLETFAPASGNPRGRKNPVEQQIESVREEAYHAGFLAGQAMATEAHLDDQRRLTAEFIEALADSRMSNEAARCHVVASLVPAIEALAAAIAPALAEAGLGREIARLVERAILTAPGVRPRLRVAPEMADTIADILQERGLGAVIEEAPDLMPREAQIFWDQGYDHLDLDACIAQATACIASHLAAGRAAQGNGDDERLTG
jgi:hypothetical protein